MEVEAFQAQALQVKMPDENFDPTKVPEDGEEFLMKVIYERNNCPAVVVKPPKDKNLKHADVLENENVSEIVDVSPSSLRPSEEWKTAQLDDFSNIRRKITTLRKRYTIDNTVPLIDEEEEWSNLCKNNQPLLKTILRINQRSLEKLLEYESEWLKTEMEEGNAVTIGNWLGQWIYSTLACLHLPLEPDTHSVLRDIAKTCILMRNKLSPDDQFKCAPLNLFIVLISKFFSQLDLVKFI